MVFAIRPDPNSTPVQWAFPTATSDANTDHSGTVSLPRTVAIVSPLTTFATPPRANTSDVSESGPTETMTVSYTSTLTVIRRAVATMPNFEYYTAPISPGDAYLA